MRLNPSLQFVVTDCLDILLSLLRGLDYATGPSRPQARLWKLIALAMDHHCPADLVQQKILWIPSHTARATVGFTLRSDGTLVTKVDWRANRLVDVLARHAANRHRVPQATRELLNLARETVEFYAARVGAVTKAANSYTQTAFREDGTTYLAKHRDAEPPPPRRARARSTPVVRKLAAPSTGQNPAAAPLTQPHRAEGQKAALTKSNDTVQFCRLAQEARFLASWHQDMACKLQRRAPDPHAPTAGERLSAMRARIREKSV